MMLNFKHIGRQIKKARSNKKITQAALAEQVEMSTTYISHIETAKKQASLEVIVRLANALDVTVDQLLCGHLNSDPLEYHTDMKKILSDCTSYEKVIICEIALATKKILHENQWLKTKNL